jgi:hypothetical protein
MSRTTSMSWAVIAATGAFFGALSGTLFHEGPALLGITYGAWRGARSPNPASTASCPYPPGFERPAVRPVLRLLKVSLHA